MEFKEIKTGELLFNPFNKIGKEWMLIAAGDEKKFNAMTASWGGFGFLWNKPVVYIFIRPERFTFEFLEKEENFSLCFFDESQRHALNLLGKVSGRDRDKIAESGLHPYFTPAGVPAFEEAKMVLQCKKLYASMLEADHFIDPGCLETWYGAKGGLHKMCVAQIEKVWVK